MFENIRREYEPEQGTIAGVARKLSALRQLVRDTICNSTYGGIPIPADLGRTKTEGLRHDQTRAGVYRGRDWSPN